MSPGHDRAVPKPSRMVAPGDSSAAEPAERSVPAGAPAAAAGPPHFYVENGLVVFTAAHHLARGSCCGSGCRHCPFEPPHAAGSRKVR